MLGKVTTSTISCAGATDRAYTDFQAYSKYRIEVNEKIAFDGDIDVNLEPLNNALDHGDIKLEFMFEGLVDIANRIQFSNVSNEHKRIKIIPYNFVDPSPENGFRGKTCRRRRTRFQQHAGRHSRPRGNGVGRHDTEPPPL